MRILAHIHTLNDEDVIDACLAAVLAQTRPVDGVLIVDNGSTDTTLERAFPAAVRVLRHEANLGTNGAVRSGMRFALEEGFDWIWLFDADSAPHKDALERLLAFHESLSPDERLRVQHLASLPVDISHGHAYHGLRLTPRGFRHVQPARPDEPYACTGTVWSGSLYRVEAIREVGLPSPDWVLDWGEVVYGYDGERRGLRSWVVPASIVDHNIDGVPTSWIHESVRLGLLRFNVMRFPPPRLYYIVRNDLYFWLHAYGERGWRQTLRLLPAWGWMPRHLLKLLLLRRWRELDALLRGARDGVLGRIERRY